MNTGKADETKSYSKEEILELIEQTKEKYGIFDMTDLGDILGEYNHNWYYYYKNKAKKLPAFLDVLLSVQNPFEMFERLRLRTTELMKKKNMTKSDMNKFCFYIKIMMPCLKCIGEQFGEDIHKGMEKILTVQDAGSKIAAMNALAEQMNQNMEKLLIDEMYLTQVVFYLEECRVQGLQVEINARNKGKENFDLKTCYEAHYGTPEFKLGRMKNQDKEDEKATCWYQVRCNSIKKCKAYEYSRKIEDLKESKELLNNAFQNATNQYYIQEEYAKIFANVCRLLEELELPEI